MAQQDKDRKWLGGVGSVHGREIPFKPESDPPRQNPPNIFGDLWWTRRRDEARMRSISRVLEKNWRVLPVHVACVD
jgi:hypothetical protein